MGGIVDLKWGGSVVKFDDWNFSRFLYSEF
jgi:hypothetical protein